ncbi:C-GCAxxG-C-C family protein [Seleniivibrio sp.]|uniref:C-GCAxxG-C-C family protein n=1 Tax=Seleniivibrio sp. TaxID=2898801 RepID=UPI0025DF5248|nr:C-GCAxxG-C-C family protein [Seleniivibrio sp.]MCD8553298.1 C-GCAxxG-C-C family protein [Seleniivibrio sp.]
MTEEILNKAAEDAVRLFKSGYSCSEAVLLSFETNTEKCFSEDAKRGMSAYVEGLSGSGCICGALSGGVFVLSTLGGRLTRDEPIDKLKTAVRTFHDDFRKEFSSACCRVITAKSAKLFGIGKYSTCPLTVEFCIRNIMKLAAENGWIK